MQNFSFRAVIYSLIISLLLGSALPNVLPGSILEKLPHWYTANQVTMGLDLRGGSHLLMEVDTRDLLITKNESMAEQLTSELRQAHIRYKEPRVEERTIILETKRAEKLDEVARIARSLIQREIGHISPYNVDTENGQVILHLRDPYIELLIKDAVTNSLEIVRHRMNESGMVEPSITRQGRNGILVQLPGVGDPAHILKILKTTARMTFHWVATEKSANRATINLNGQLPSERYKLEKRVAMEGKHIKDARFSFNSLTTEPVVNFRLDNAGAQRFAHMTQNNIGRPLAIVLDERVITAPIIKNAITNGSGEISGAFTSEEAHDLALLLRAGSLPAPLNVIEQRSVGPELGSDAIEMGVATGLTGAALVLAFIMAVYGRWGLIACLGLAVNVGLVFGILSMLRATLTLPGIAGLILSIGMAVDANILINERIREETRKGKRAYAALDSGFKRALRTIVDSNITSLIAICLLFLIGEGPVRGFAVTLAIGLMTSMFTAISVTRLVMEWRVQYSGAKSLVIPGHRWIEYFYNKNSSGDSPINFMRIRFLGLVLSGILSIASLVLIAYPGLNYGIDFTGGSLIEVQNSQVSIEQLRRGLQDADLENIPIQEFGNKSDYLIRLPLQSDEKINTDYAKEAVLNIAPDADFPRTEMVGSRVSGEFADTSIVAIISAGIGMLIYLWLRFETHFAVGAITTLALDLTKTLGFFVLAGVEFNLTAVAALLTLIGYSINDKVVVFDRIRENLMRSQNKPLMEVLNISISSTIVRTILTSFTTFIAILPMAISGGHAVASFALPILFGIVIGTSSSILIAAPIVLHLGQRRMLKGLSQLHSTREELRKP